eukprot:IDg17342t1
MRVENKLRRCICAHRRPVRRQLCKFSRVLELNIYPPNCSPSHWPAFFFSPLNFAHLLVHALPHRSHGAACAARGRIERADTACHTRADVLEAFVNVLSCESSIACITAQITALRVLRRVRHRVSGGEGAPTCRDLQQWQPPRRPRAQAAARARALVTWTVAQRIAPARILIGALCPANFSARAGVAFAGNGAERRAHDRAWERAVHVP